MLTTEEKANRRLNSPDNLAKKVADDRNPKFIQVGEAEIRPMHNGGRRNGDTNVPDFIRELAGTLAHVEKHKNVAKEFNISESSVSAYEVGAHSTDSYHSPDKDLSKKVSTNLDRARELAVEKLVSSMELMEPEKLQKASIKDLSTVAASMSRVVERTSPKELGGLGGAQIIFYSPTINVEADYKTIHIEKEKSE